MSRGDHSLSCDANISIINEFHTKGGADGAGEYFTDTLWAP